MLNMIINESTTIHEILEAGDKMVAIGTYAASAHEALAYIHEYYWEKALPEGLTWERLHKEWVATQ